MAKLESSWGLRWSQVGGKSRPSWGQVGAKLGKVGGQEAPKCSEEPGANKKVGGNLRWSWFLAHVDP